MFKDLLLVDMHAKADEPALAASLALAAHLGAHVTVLVVVEIPRPVPSEWATYPAAVYTGLSDEVRAEGRKRAERLRSRLQGETVPTEVRLTDAVFLPLSRTAALQARHADLAVVAGAAEDEDRGAIESVFVELLMDAGRPVLLVPDGATVELPAQHAVIAWQPTREAARAVHDALPLLAAARTVDVLMIDPDVGEDGHGQEPGADIARHLARHGLEVRVVAQPRAGRAVGAAILEHVETSGAGLLVSGGYSRSRFRQQILGGVTRDLLDGARVPVLFSH